MLCKIFYIYLLFHHHHLYLHTILVGLFVCDIYINTIVVSSRLVCYSSFLFFSSFLSPAHLYLTHDRLFWTLKTFHFISPSPAETSSLSWLPSLFKKQGGMHAMHPRQHQIPDRLLFLPRFWKTDNYRLFPKQFTTSRHTYISPAFLYCCVIFYLLRVISHFAWMHAVALKYPSAHVFHQHAPIT